MGRLFDIFTTPLAVLGVLFMVVAVNVFLYLRYSSKTPTLLPAEHTGPSTIIETTERKNGKIAFQSDRGGSYEIYTMNADGTKIHNLTSDPAKDADPTFSPDGNKIAFRRNRHHNSDIYTVNPKGTWLIQLTTDPAEDDEPAFSPDGKKVAFDSDRSGNSDIYKMNVKGTSLIRLTTDPATTLGADWAVR